jgi:hypothetical protein
MQLGFKVNCNLFAIAFRIRVAMLKWQTKIERKEEEKHVYNAFSAHRFFSDDYHYYKKVTTHTTLDKISMIDDIISANISALTHRSKQE